tara:strand:+ start:774 stop:983 length:210 start_codon:yes stop_codon:yes gene_type:complete
MGTGADPIGPPVDESQLGITSLPEDALTNPVYRRWIVLAALMTALVLGEAGVLPVQTADWLGPLLSVLL